MAYKVLAFQNTFVFSVTPTKAFESSVQVESSLRTLIDINNQRSPTAFRNQLLPHALPSASTLAARLFCLISFLIRFWSPGWYLSCVHLVF